MDNLSATHFVLFFTRPFSLQSWLKGGMLDRELALYIRLLDEVKSVTLVTYGDRSDLEIQKQYPDLKVICNRWGVSEKQYVKYITRILPLFMPKPAIFKSNQVLGSDVGLMSARRAGAKYMARCGNLRSLNAARESGSNSQQAIQAREIEKLVFPASDRVIIPTLDMANYIQKEYCVSREKIIVIPNYVDTTLFSPHKNIQPEKNRLCFIGRLERVKNIMAILQAIVGLDISMTIVGNGSLQPELEKFAKENHLDVDFRGVVSNKSLPVIINEADIYIQPSFYEGHPKTIIEAMACGSPVIAANSPGIRELITHEKNGFLCETSAESIRAAILQLLSNPDFRQLLGQNARDFAVANFSLDHVVDLELSVLEELSRELNKTNNLKKST